MLTTLLKKMFKLEPKVVLRCDAIVQQKFKEVQLEKISWSKGPEDHNV